jgi:hypothetical protein
MSELAMRAAIGVAALLVGLAIGWLVARSAPSPGTGPTPRIGNRKIVVVGPTAADVQPPKIALSKRNADEILWISAGPGHDLVIQSDKRLFEQQSQQGNGRWAMTCSEHTCESKAILGDAALGSYKYWQLFVRNGQVVEEADGWIIIER